MSGNEVTVAFWRHGMVAFVRTGFEQCREYSFWEHVHDGASKISAVIKCEDRFAGVLVVLEMCQRRCAWTRGTAWHGCDECCAVGCACGCGDWSADGSKAQMKGLESEDLSRGDLSRHSSPHWPGSGQGRERHAIGREQVAQLVANYLGG